MTVSEHLAEYILSVKEKQLPEKQINIARTFFIDAMACMFLGASSDSVKRAMEFVKEYAGPGKSIFPGPQPMAMDSAHCAMLCAMAAHSNDFDDMSASLNGHPSALIVPVVFSLGQKLGSGGKELLRAYIAGVETDAIIDIRIGELGYRKGVNPTNFIGIFGAVAAAGLLLGLDGEGMTNALGIAANEATGFKANFGTRAKDLAIGMSALKAVACAECASHGIDSSRDALEGPFGLFESICGDSGEELLHRLIEEHGSEFIDPGMIMKPYPSCRGNHSGIGCITKIVEKHKFGLEDVEQIICRVDEAAYDTDRYEYPSNPGEAKFSLAFCIAKVIECGKVSIDDFIGDEILDKKPMELIDRVKIVCVPELFENSRFGTEVEVRLTDGSVFTEKECYAKGDPLYPMTEEEVGQKLKDCLSRIATPEKALEGARLLSRLEDLKNAGEIIDFLYSERKR